MRFVFALAVLAAPASAQVFVLNTTDIPTGSPSNSSATENVDFGDVDLDGDWDAVFADGGDLGADQNRLWINQGGLQGGTTGEFVDATTSQLPAVNDQSRDVEFADMDGDGDLDLYVANVSNLFNQTSRFWMNAGLDQNGAPGTYVDETATRWVGLGGPGSSVDPAIVLPGGGFIVFDMDSDFGDLDADGDLDLVQSNAGGAMSGLTPTRMWLNDGDGFFSEFNPSGFQVTALNINNGDPALWAEGLQQHNTTNTDGSFADIAVVSTDLDIADIDGDYDLDVILTDRQVNPRLFVNRLSETGTLAFRDRSAAQLGSVASGGVNFETEFGDADLDGDVDLAGLNFDGSTFGGFNEVMFENDGAGDFTSVGILPNSGDDDEEIDYFDYDNDGDLDLFVANFSGVDRLYDNGPGATAFGYTFVDSVTSGLNISLISKDADAADVDGDGDYDVFGANGAGGGPNPYYENQTGVADTSAPYLPQVEDLADAAATTGTRMVRAHVYDNAPYYITWYNPTELNVEVDGVDLPAYPMASSGGQVFRAEIPANLVGTVSYSAHSEDGYGNGASSSAEGYDGSGTTGTVYGAGSPGSLGEPTIGALTAPIGGEVFHLVGGNVPAFEAVVFGVGFGSIPTLDLGDGILLNVNPSSSFLEVRVADAEGNALLTSPSLPSLPGSTIFVQAFTQDGTGGDTYASSKGFEFTLQ